MTKSIGAAMAGGNPTEKRQDNDWYPTPDECTIGLMKAEQDHIRQHTDSVWECACGNGKMSEVMKEFGFDVTSTDLVYRGYGTEGDFFTYRHHIAPTAIITNPPFNLAAKFIEHSLDVIEAPYLALLLKSTFWHARRRYDLFERHTPSVIYPMTWRPDFMNRGAPTMDCSWVVWDKARTGTKYIPMLKPDVN